MNFSILISRLTWVDAVYLGDHVLVLHLRLVYYLHCHPRPRQLVPRL